MNSRQSKKALDKAFQSFAMDRATSRKYDGNGFYRVEDNPISKVGVFPYMGATINAVDSSGNPFPTEPGKVYNVFRSPEALSDKDFIESLHLMPWIDDHEMLGEGYRPAEEKGVEGVIGQTVYFKNDTLYANLQLFSNDLDNKIDGGKKELSLGYKCKYIYSPGVYKGQPYDFMQVELRANHIASVDKGRMGKEVAVKDQNDTTTNKGILDMKPEEVAAIVATAVDSALTPVLSQLEGLQTAMDAAESKATEKEVKADRKERDDDDDKDGKKKEPKKSAGQDSAVISAEAMDAAVLASPAYIAMQAQLKAVSIAADSVELKELYEGISPHSGAFDHADMNTGAMVDYGLKNLNVACDSADAGIRKATLKTALSYMPEVTVPVSTSIDSADCDAMAMLKAV